MTVSSPLSLPGGVPSPEELIRLGSLDHPMNDWRDRLWAHPLMADDGRMSWVGGLWMLAGIFFFGLAMSEPGVGKALGVLVMLLTVPGCFLFSFGIVGLGKLIQESRGAHIWAERHTRNPALLARAALEGDLSQQGILARVATEHLNKHHPDWRQHLMWNAGG